MMKQQPVIALLTDFGTVDAYVGTMKAVILSINPLACIIDITHDVHPQHIDEGAFLLWSSYKFYLKGTIFVCIVDPGVGSRRNIVCVDAGGYRFLAPDNGILKYVLSDSPPRRIVTVSNLKYSLPKVSSTFHGRDIFAPIAAHLSKGLLPSKLGRETKATIESEDFVTPNTQSVTRGRILHIDRFGNLITNILLTQESANTYNLKVGSKLISLRMATYAEAPKNRPFFLRGSSGLLEVSIRNGSAAKTLRARLGEKVFLLRKKH